jgi:hypothetical protein
MDCPRCGYAGIAETSCPRCGVVFAKLASARSRASAATPPPARRTKRGSQRGLLVPLGILLVVVVVAALAAPRRPAPTASHAPAAASAPEPMLPAAPTEPTPAPQSISPPPREAFQRPAVGADDRTLAQELVQRVNARSPVSAGDIQRAEVLFSRYPDERVFQDLLGTVLLAAGAEEARARRLEPALGHLRRSAGLLEDNREPRLALLGVLYELGDWSGVEAAARDVLALDPRDADVLERLAYALFRQDRNREALDVVQQALEVRPSAFSQTLLDRIRKGAADERGMTQQQLSHFHVRYDGDAHEDIGREILGALERHYSTLAGTLDHRPGAPIPVILFSRQQYYDASGAPAWSGGQFSHFDGRIRIPIGGLTARLSPDMDGTLIHEVTHAFVADRSRGRCPRDVNEGLAQYMEGRRVARELSADQLRALADGRIPGVAGFYLQALSFVEYLIGARGQGGVNDLLLALGETGDEDEAFEQVYGAKPGPLREAWLNRLRRQHGS